MSSNLGKRKALAQIWCGRTRVSQNQEGKTHSHHISPLHGSTHIPTSVVTRSTLYKQAVFLLREERLQR